jgi:5-methylcytosine-specific restriction endonuclease McrA
MHKFCKTCGVDSERYADGRCKACTLRRHKEWVSKNRDLVNATSRKWSISNSAQKRATNAEYREAKRDEINEKRRLQRQADPSLERRKSATRRALKRKNGGELSKDIVQRLLIVQKGLCACCASPLGGFFHLDHVVPLSLGGKNDDANVQLLLPKCNLQKHKSTPEAFLARRQKEKLQQ